MWVLRLLRMGVMMVLMDKIKVIMGVGMVLRGNDADGGGSHLPGSVIGSRLTEEIQITYTVCQLRQLCSHCFVSAKAPPQRPPEHFSRHRG